MRIQKRSGWIVGPTRRRSLSDAPEAVRADASNTTRNLSAQTTV